MKYPLIIHKDKDSSFGVTVPDIPGCFSAGDTLEEAMENAEEAIYGHLGILAENGEDIPKGSPIEDHLKKAKKSGTIIAVVDIDSSKFLGKAKKINITLPEYLINRIDEAVANQEQYKSRSGFLGAATIKELGL